MKLNLPLHWYALATMVVDSIGIGIMMPILPSLLEDFTGQPAVSTSGVYLWLAAAYALMQFLFGPLIGNLSDRFGRRPILLVAGAVLAIDYLIMAVAPSLFWLFVGRVSAGIAGATVTVAYAVAADVSTPQNKAANFGLMSAAFGLGFVLGPVMGGLLSQFGPRVPFYVSSALIGVNFLVGLFFFRETLQRQYRRALSWHSSNPISALLKVRDAKGAVNIIFADFFFALAMGVYTAIWAYYTRAVAGWDDLDVSISLAIYGAGYVAVQAFLTQPLIQRFGVRGVIFFGVCCELVAMIGLMFAPNGVVIYAGVPLVIVGGVAIPAITLALSNSVDRSRQGEIQGVSKSFFAVASVITPVATIALFSYFTSDAAPFYWPGAPFLFSALTAPMALVLIWYGGRKSQLDKPTT